MIRKFLLLVTLGLALVTLQGSSCRGLVQPNPTQSEIDRVHADAKRIGDAVVTLETIADQVGVFINELPLTVAQKNEYDCLVVKANGTRTPRPALLTVCGPSTPQGPGPIPQGLEKIKSLTTDVGLSTTVREITSAFQPLLTKMQTSSNTFVKGLGVVAATSFAILMAYLSGGF